MYIYTRVVLQDLVFDRTVSSFLRNCALLFIEALQVCTPPAMDECSVDECSPYPISSSVWAVICFVDLDYSYWCKIKSQSNFDLHFPDVEQCVCVSSYVYMHVFPMIFLWFLFYCLFVCLVLFLDAFSWLSPNEKGKEQVWIWMDEKEGIPHNIIKEPNLLKDRKIKLYS